MNQHTVAWACTLDLSALWTSYVSAPEKLWYGYQGCKLTASISSQWHPHLHGGSVLLYLSLQLRGNWTPCAWHTFRSCLVRLCQVNQGYCEFCGLSQLHRYQGTKEIVKRLQIKHSLHPIDPFCIRSNRRSIGTLALYTTLSKYTQCRVVSSIFLCKIQSQQVWYDLRLPRCFLVWCLCGKYHFCAYGRWLL